MKTFILNEDQVMLKELAEELVTAEINTRSEEVDHEQKYPQEGIQILAESGLIACAVPEKYEGAELGYWSQMAVIEEIAKECGSTALAAAQIAEAAECILKHGTEEQKAEYLPQLVCGTAAAVIGSDAGVNGALDVTVTAEKTVDGYVLNGVKKNVFNAAECAWYLMAVKAEDGIQWVIVDKGANGVNVEAGPVLLGFKGCKVGNIVLDHCEVSKEKVLSGSVTETFTQIQTLYMAAIASGIAQGALKEAIAYVNQRVQFKKTIAQFQNTQQVMAELLAKSEAARALVWEAAKVKDAGAQAGYVAALAKIMAADAAALISKKCVQFMGGYGYSREYPVERKMRDAKMTEIVNGASFVQKEFVAKKKVVQS